jgi:hypothetical protein
MTSDEAAEADVPSVLDQWFHGTSLSVPGSLIDAAAGERAQPMPAAWT